MLIRTLLPLIISLGCITVFFIVRFFIIRYKNKKAIILQREQEVIKQTIKDYDILMDHMINSIYWNENPEEFSKFYHEIFSRIRLKNRSSGLLQINTNKRKHIENLDLYVYDTFSTEKTPDLHKLCYRVQREIKKLDEMVG